MVKVFFETKSIFGPARQDGLFRASAKHSAFGGTASASGALGFCCAKTSRASGGMVYTQDLKSCGRKALRVRFPPCPFFVNDAVFIDSGSVRFRRATFGGGLRRDRVWIFEMISVLLDPSLGPGWLAAHPDNGLWPFVGTASALGTWSKFFCKKY